MTEEYISVTYEKASEELNFIKKICVSDFLFTWVFD